MRREALFVPARVAGEGRGFRAIGMSVSPGGPVRDEEGRFFLRQPQTTSPVAILSASSTPHAARDAFSVVVAGGGISGLAAAHRLGELAGDRPAALIDAAPRLGGVLETIHDAGYLLEKSADNFITSVPWAVDLCRRIGFDQELIPTEQGRRQALVLRRGKLLPVPDGFLLMAPTKLWPIVVTPILSPWGKLRLCGEYFVPPRSNGDESLASFVRRRLGREAFERLVQPLIGGIYTADPEKLSLAATLPRFLEMERKHGGLIRAMLREPRPAGATGNADRGARYSLFTAPRRGLSSLTAALEKRLSQNTTILTGTSVERLEPAKEGGWRLRLSSPQGERDVRAGAVILALPAPVAARLAAPFDAQLSAAIGEIEYASTAIVMLGYRRDQIADPLAGFGVVVPAVENRAILAASFSSLKYADRAPEGEVLVRVFLGGAGRGDVVERSESQLEELAHRELSEMLGITGPPRIARVVRWKGVMPQYHVGHCERVARIESLVGRHATLALAGNAYHGVGIPHCIHSGEQAAERIVQALAAAR